MPENNISQADDNLNRVASTPIGYDSQREETDDRTYDKEYVMRLVKEYGEAHPILGPGRPERPEVPPPNDSANKKNNNEKKKSKQEHDKEKPKHELPTYKYSRMGKEDLHESIILDGVPAFIKYDRDNRQIEIVNKIEEQTRILVPPSLEEYSYIPYEFTNREELEEYIQLAKAENIESLYRKALSFVKIYNDQDDYKQILIALDIVWSYFQDKFSTTHYEGIVGDNDSGKSTVGGTFEAMAYRCVNTTNPSAANVFRILGTIEPGQSTMILDESRNIDESPDMMCILNTGYDYLKKVPKTNTNTWKQEFFFTYGLKIIIGEASLNQHKARGVLDRTFRYTTYPGDPESDIKEVMNPQGDRYRQRELDGLMHFRNLMLIYRLIHFNHPIPDIDIGVKRRNKELCKPYIQLFYGTKVQKEIEETLQIFIDTKNTRKSTSIESALLPLVSGLISEITTDMSMPEKNVVKSSRIWDKITTTLDGQVTNNKLDEFHTSDYGTLYRTTITKMICDKFGATSKHTKSGNVLTFDLDKLHKIERSYCTDVKIKTTLKNVTGDDGEGSEYSEGSMESASTLKQESNYNTLQNLQEKQDETEENINNTIVSTSDIPITPINNSNSTIPRPFTPFTAFTSPIHNNPIEESPKMHSQEESPYYEIIGTKIVQDCTFYHCKLHPEIDSFRLEFVEEHCKSEHPGSFKPSRAKRL